MSAIAIQPNKDWLAVCRVKAEALSTQDNGAQTQQHGYFVDFEILEDLHVPAGQLGDFDKTYERMLNCSQLLAGGQYDRLVLQMQSDFPGRIAGAQWAAESSDAKIERYQTLKRLLQTKYTSKQLKPRKTKSMEKAMQAFADNQQQLDGAGGAHTSAAAPFGTPQSIKAYRKKKINMRDAAQDFLASERCLSPGAADAFDRYKAQPRLNLADALWLAMYDVQEQIQEQQKRKRGRGADPKGVYKANKRPAPAAAAAAAGVGTPAGAGSSAAAAAAAVGPATPEQPRRQRGANTAAAAGGGGRRGVSRRLGPSGGNSTAALWVSQTPASDADVIDLTAD